MQKRNTISRSPVLAAAFILVLLSGCTQSEPTEADLRQAMETTIKEQVPGFQGFDSFKKVNCGYPSKGDPAANGYSGSLHYCEVAYVLDNRAQDRTFLFDRAWLHGWQCEAKSVDILPRYGGPP